MYEKYSRLRDAKGLNDHQVVLAAGLTPSTIYEWRRGTYTPKVDKLAKIAKVLEVPLEELLNLDD